MTRFLKGALIGAIALGGLAMNANESSAMPVAGVEAPAISADAGQHADIQKAYWRRGWGWGWRRPGWRYGWGWRRPWGWRYGWGWRRPYLYHPYRRFYRW